MTNDHTFTFKRIKKQYSSEIIIVNNYTKEFFSIIPEYGGRLKELSLNNGNRNISLIKKVERIDSNDRDDIFTNAKLSPFAGRIKDGKYSLNNTTYKLNVNYPEEGNACHGFIYNKKFQVKDKIDNQEFASCSLVYNYENENNGYPFEYEIELIYKLTTNNGLICTTKITNHSEISIPLSDGWHHYFDLGVKVDDLKLKLDVSEIMELDKKNIPTGIKKLYDDFSTPTTLGNSHLDSCFKIHSINGRAETELIFTNNKIDLKFGRKRAKINTNI